MLLLAAAIILAALPRVAIVIPGYDLNPATGLLWLVVAYMLRARWADRPRHWLTDTLCGLGIGTLLGDIARETFL